MGRPEGNVAMFDTYLRRLPCVYSRGHSRFRGNGIVVVVVVVVVVAVLLLLLLFS